MNKAADSNSHPDSDALFFFLNLIEGSPKLIQKRGHNDPHLSLDIVSTIIRIPKMFFI